MNGVIRRDDRVVIRMFGRDPLKMIQGLATNDIAGAPELYPVYTAFLTPKGKMVGDARVVRLPNGDIWIEADRAAAENIVASLKKFVPPLFARFEMLADMAFVECVGMTMSMGICPDGGVLLLNPFRADSTTFVLKASELLEDVRDTLTAADLERMRIEAGEPKWGAELTEDVIPLEAGLKDVAISQNKGCYTGQEVIIRILHRGHVNRHLRGLLFGDAMPEVGAELTHNDKVVGKITSVVHSEKFGQTIALGYVRREVEVGASVLAGPAVGKVVELPFS